MLKTVHIRLLWHKQAQFAGYLLAEKLRLGRKYGIELVCEGVDFKCKHVASVLTGATPMAVASPAHVLESANPNALRWILTTQQESPLVYPVRKADGIERLADLAGRKVGVWPGHEDLEFRWMLLEAGLSADAVERIPMPDTVEPFVAGEISSGQMTNYHELHLAESRLGAHAIRVFSARGMGCSVLKDGLVVSRSYAEESPETVQAVVNAVLEGWTLALCEPELVIRTCAEIRPDLGEEEHRRQFQDIRALVMTGATLSHGLGYPDPAHVEQATRALRKVTGVTVESSLILDPRYWEAAPEQFRERNWS